MKIFLLAPNENWILDRIAKEWIQINPRLTTSSLDEADIIWLISAWQWMLIPRHILQSKKVVATIHHIVPEKFTKDKLREFLVRDQFVDQYHTPCQKTKEFVSKITKKPIDVVGYWYNSDFWHPEDKTTCRQELEIPQDKYVIGSFQRDTEGHDLKSPKLEKGPDLFIEALKNMNKPDLFILLGGWRRQYIMKRLEEQSVPYKYIEMASMDTLRKMYASCDLYIVSSRYEGGPQALLEASAMRVPIISRDVGMASAVLSKECVVDIPENLYFPLDDDINWCYNNVKQFELQNCIKRYEEMFVKLLQENL